MKKGVEREIKKIDRWVKKQTDEDVSIIDFLYDATENYEFDDCGKPATVDWTNNGLWFEAEKFVEVWKENHKPEVVMKRININNGDYIEIIPKERGLSVERRDQNGKLERKEYVPDGDFVMLMNYWRNCKHGIEKSYYISSF